MDQRLTAVGVELGSEGLGRSELIGLDRAPTQTSLQDRRVIKGQLVLSARGSLGGKEKRVEQVSTRIPNLVGVLTARWMELKVGPD